MALVRATVSLIWLVLFLGACVGSEGFSIGVLRCETELSEEGIANYTEDAVGYETIAEAIDAFRSEESWQVRDDWRALTADDMSSSPVRFTDDRGWV